VRIGEAEIERLYKSLLTKTDGLIRSLGERVAAEKNAEEQEKARKMREEMERQLREKKQEEEAKQAEEDNKRRSVRHGHCCFPKRCVK
jgi:myosin-6